MVLYNYGFVVQCTCCLVVITFTVWIYGTIAVLVISLAAILGGLIIPCCPPSFYEKFILTLISLAIAVLAGDALIHLLPLVS